jgi:hypothetical protein
MLQYEYQSKKKLTSFTVTYNFTCRTEPGFASFYTTICSISLNFLRVLPSRRGMMLKFQLHALAREDSWDERLHVCWYKLSTIDRGSKNASDLASDKDFFLVMFAVFLVAIIKGGEAGGIGCHPSWKCVTHNFCDCKVFSMHTSC